MTGEQMFGDMEAEDFVSADELARSYIDARLAGRVDRPLKGGSLRAGELLDCPRKMLLHYSGVEPTDPPDERALLLFQEGHDHEASLIETLKKAGVKIDGQQDWVRMDIHPIADDAEPIRVYGRIDGRLGDGRILECKSANKEMSSLKRPSKSHRCQIEVYMRDQGAPGAVLFYKSRVDGSVKAFEYEPDDKLWERIRVNVGKVASAIGDLDALPPVRLTECRWCRYRNLCWGAS